MHPTDRKHIAPWSSTAILDPILTHVRHGGEVHDQVHGGRGGAQQAAHRRLVAQVHVLVPFGMAVRKGNDVGKCSIKGKFIINLRATDLTRDRHAGSVLQRKAPGSTCLGGCRCGMVPYVKTTFRETSAV